jgi:tetratricopeptide (TPR) repeat protein
MHTEETDHICEMAAEPDVQGSLSAERRPPEQSEEFTALDNLLIRTIVDVAQNIEGAPREEELEDIIGEIIHLNSTTCRRYFHKGFMQGILKRDAQFSFPEENAARRGWYFTGIIMGLLRHLEDDRILQVCSEHPDTMRDISTNPALDACFSMLGPHLYRLYTKRGDVAQAVDFISHKVALLKPRDLEDIFNNAAQFLRAGLTGNADLIFTLLYRNLQPLTLANRNYLFFDIRVERKKAQVLQQRGDLSAARAIFESILQRMDPRDIRGQAYVLSDIGLLEGGFRSISQLMLPTPDKYDLFKTSLEQGEAQFEKAIALSSATPNARYCLGMLRYLQGRFDDATNFLDAALVGMLSDEQAYQSVGILDSCRYMLATAIFECMDESRFIYASDNLRKAFDHGLKPPERMVKSLMEFTSNLLDEEFSSYVCDYLFSACGNSVLHFAKPVHIGRCLSIRDAMEGASSSDKVPTAIRWDFNRRLLEHYLTTGDFDQAVEKLDQLEILSAEPPERDRFIELIGEPRNYEPAWDRSDARYARIRLLELAGRYEEAAGLLTEEFHRLCSERDNAASLLNAQSILETIGSYGLLGEYTTTLELRLKAAQGIEQQVAAQPSGPAVPCSLLFVGGNETQERYDALITASLSRQHPQITVTFAHTNWTTMWSDQLELIKDRMEHGKYDALVIMTYIRTTLGQRLRAACSEQKIIWHACTGHGKSSMENSILSAYRLYLTSRAGSA